MVVIGVGGVGLTAVVTLTALGHRAICAVDRSEANLDAARELGASLAVKMLTVEGSFVGTLPELHEVVDLATRGALPRIPISDARWDLDGVTTALDRLTAGGVTGRIVLRGAAQ